MRRALWVVPVAEDAGVARHVLDATRAGILGWAITVAAPDGPLLDALQADGHDTRSLPISTATGTVPAVRALRSLLRTERPDVAHSHLARADILLAMASVGTGVPLVSTEHGIAADPLLYNPNRAVATVKRLAHRARCTRFSSIIAVSESTRDQVLHQWHPRCPVTVIHNGIDRVPASRSASGARRFLTLSRLAPEKNLPAVLGAFSAVRADLPDATLTVAGTGSQLNLLRETAAAIGLSDSVKFPGHVDAADALAHHDVLVQLSAWENCSYALLDALNAGLGVVATPVGGNPEILPPFCLTPPAPGDRVAEAMIRQATEDNRPTLPTLWPSVADMTAGIAQVYEKVTR